MILKSNAVSQTGIGVGISYRIHWFIMIIATAPMDLRARLIIRILVDSESSLKTVLSQIWNYSDLHRWSRNLEVSKLLLSWRKTTF